MTSELAANAVTHASTSFDVAVVEDDARIRVFVVDHSAELPTLMPRVVDAVGGRGLQIIEALSTAWGTRGLPGMGKAVWFEVPA